MNLAFATCSKGGVTLRKVRRYLFFGILGILCAGLTPFAYAYTLVEDHFDDGINEEVWRIYRSSETGVIQSVSGNLLIYNVMPADYTVHQNRVLGLMLREPINMYDASITITIQYETAGNPEQNIGLWNLNALSGVQFGGSEPTKAELEQADIYFYPGFRLTVGNSWIAGESTGRAGGEWRPGLGVGFSMPLTITWQLDYVSGGSNDSEFKVTLTANEEQVYRGFLRPGLFDPAEAYFYFYVSTRDVGGLTAIDYIKVTREPYFLSGS